MMFARTIAASVLTLVACMMPFAPAAAFGQTNNQGRLIVAVDNVHIVPATDDQVIRVTIGNPNRPVLVDDSHFLESSFSIELDGAAAPVTIGPGKSLTYTLEVRNVGVLVDSSTGLRHVRVGARITKVAIDSTVPRELQPSFLIEILNRRTGKLESFHTFPGFAGGVYVAAGDVN